MIDMKPWDIVTETLKLLVSSVKPGITTKELDIISHNKIIELGGVPVNLNYHPDFAATPYPASICTCINDEVAHGIPSDRILQDGDIVGLDTGVEKDEVCGDAAITVGVGQISDRDKRLLWNAKKVLYAGIKQVKAGVKIRDISLAMENCALINGYILNVRFCGHTIGKKMHEDPKIPNIYLLENGEELIEGQMICLEPMLTYNDKLAKIDPDGWTWRTQDGKHSAVFEHQILVLKDGYEVLTKHFDESKIW